MPATESIARSIRRVEILRIATNEFARRGYAGTTVKHIADTANILAGSLYHHFRSKEAIFEEVLRELIDDSVARYERAVRDGGTACEVIARLVGHGFALIEERRDQVIIYQNERSLLFTESQFGFVVDGHRRMDAIWLEQLRRGQEAGEIRPTLDPVITSRFIRDGLWSSVRWIIPGGAETAETLSAQFLEFLWGGIAR